VPTPPLDLVEYEGRPPFADFKPVSMDDYIEQNETRWAFRTSIGDVVLKKLSQMDRDRINVAFFEERPDLVVILTEAQRLREFQRKGIPLDAEHEKKLESSAKLLRPLQVLFSMACFVKYKFDESGAILLDEEGRPKEFPMFETLRVYDAFLTALNAEEVDRVYTLLTELTSIRSATASCEILLLIAKEYGIPISKNLTLKNMTAEQADILVNTLEKKGELMKREMDKIAE